MKKIILALFAFLLYVNANAQFSSSKDYRLWYKYEYDLVDGVKIKKDPECKYYFIFVHRGRSWDFAFNRTWSIDDISEEEAMKYYASSVDYDSNFEYFNESASDSQQWVYTSKENGKSWHYIFKPDLSAVVLDFPSWTRYYKRIDIYKEKANANKKPQHFFDE